MRRYAGWRWEDGMVAMAWLWGAPLPPGEGDMTTLANWGLDRDADTTCTPGLTFA